MEVDNHENRKYYAEYCPYGVNISYDSFNRNAYDFYCFDSKKARDEWVNKHAYDPYGKLVAAPTKLENVRYCKGRDFKIFHNVIVRDDYEIDDYLHGKEIKE